MIHLQWAVVEPQYPDELQQSPNDDPLHWYLFEPAQEPSGLIEPGVGVAMFDDIGRDEVEVGVGNGSRKRMLQFPLWHLFSPQNADPVPY